MSTQGYARRARLIVLSFATALASAAQTTQEDAATVFRSEVRQVRVDVQVLDRKTSAPIADLRREDFEVRDRDEVRSLSWFSADEASLEVLFLMDVSRSMTPALQRAAREARMALGELRAGDRAGVAKFALRKKMVVPMTDDRALVLAGLDQVAREPGFGTDLIGGIHFAAQQFLALKRTDARRVVLLVSDNVGGYPSRTTAAATRVMWEADAALFGLVVRAADGSKRTSRGRGLAVTRADSIARDTGGEMVNVGDGNALAEILRRVRRRYSLAFPAAPDGKPGEQRKIDVRLSPGARERYPEAVIRARTAYRIPERPN
ncbi:MAG: VWA domain-containing protein [Bryobacteraceae bacterium]|nr:VWA domain-containing protein [Bryobacteraceae bacterium]